MKNFIVMLPIVLALAGCTKKNGDVGGEITYRFEGTETFSVASEKGIYMHAIGGYVPSTMLRKDGAGDWFAQPVGGFGEYEEGNEYVIEADRYRAIVPAGLIVDGPWHHYTLKKIVSKVKRDTENISWFIPYSDSWEPGAIQWPATPVGQLTVIRTAEEMEALTGRTYELAKEFFKRHSILLTSGTGNSGIAKIEKHLMYKGRGNYLFEINVTRNDATVAQPWTVAVLVPAIPAAANVSLTVKDQ